MNIHILLIIVSILILQIAYLYYSIYKLKKIYYSKDSVFKNSAIMGENDPMKEPDYRILIEIMNPLLIAQKESSLAKSIMDVAPTIVKKKIYEESMKEITREMKLREIDSKIDLIVI